MMRVRAIVLAADERKVLKGLGALGAVHLTRAQADPDTALLSPTDFTGELLRYDRIRTRIQDLRQSLEIHLVCDYPLPTAILVYRFGVHRRPGDWDALYGDL